MAQHDIRWPGKLDPQALLCGWALSMCIGSMAHSASAADPQASLTSRTIDLGERPALLQALLPEGDIKSTTGRL